jgi:N-formylglutamate amidohydrolase
MFGEAILIDCHSMPHEALEAVAGGSGRPPEVVLGDRFGAAARPAIVDRLEAIFAEAGLRVARNMPFAGAYITQSYGRPARRQHAVQIEIDRALYMDERRVAPNGRFESFRRLMESIVADIAAMGRPAELGMAAE